MLIQQIIDAIFGMSLFINAMLFIPQAIKIYQKKSGENLSFTMFIGFLLIQFAAVLYGYIHQDQIIMYGYFLSMICCSLVVIMAMIYRKN